MTQGLPRTRLWHSGASDWMRHYALLMGALGSENRCQQERLQRLGMGNSPPVSALTAKRSIQSRQGVTQFLREQVPCRASRRHAGRLTGQRSQRGMQQPSALLCAAGGRSHKREQELKPNPRAARGRERLPDFSACRAASCTHLSTRPQHKEGCSEPMGLLEPPAAPHWLCWGAVHAGQLCVQGSQRTPSFWVYNTCGLDVNIAPGFYLKQFVTL